MLANLLIMLFPYAHKFYQLCFYFCPFAHIMLEYPNRITVQENNYSNYLTFIIINFIATARKVQCSPVGYSYGSWILGTRPVSTRLYVRLSAVAL